eukprot:TRINITY_DN86509_c0_g1_i1.p1 TRINITY_DN86509_c0_g1~~TRINITY_DN86509_c0_g1_i1.p1  ORF type:complete len:379 (+),score=70.65 TRINITY_DN86509_c0_g1_i1:34-1170(+)
MTEQEAALVGEEEEDETINNPDVLKKYQAAADICNKAMAAVVNEIAPGKQVFDLLEISDNTITNLAAAADFKPKDDDEKLEKGIAFPTCINVGPIVCHYAPMKGTNEGKLTLKEGDIVRIDLGCHIDGYSAVQAHTMIVKPAEEPIKGKYASVMTAAQQCMDAGLRSLRPGTKNTEVTALWDKICEAHSVNMAEGILSHQLKRYVIDGNKSIIAKQTAEQKVEEITFAENEVWTLDVVVSSSQNKLREGDSRAFVYKRNPEQQYHLKLKTGREVLREIGQRFQTFPFSVRHLKTRGSLLGIKDCLAHDLIATYPVLYCRDKDVVVHLKATALITPTGIQVVTGADLPKQAVETETKCEDEKVTAALGQSFDIKKDGGK